MLAEMGSFFFSLSLSSRSTRQKEKHNFALSFLSWTKKKTKQPLTLQERRAVLCRRVRGGGSRRGRRAAGPRRGRRGRRSRHFFPQRRMNECSHWFFCVRALLVFASRLQLSSDLWGRGETREYSRGEKEKKTGETSRGEPPPPQQRGKAIEKEKKKSGERRETAGDAAFSRPRHGGNNSVETLSVFSLLSPRVSRPRSLLEPL